MASSSDINTSSFVDFKINTLKLILILIVAINVGYAALVMIGTHIESYDAATLNSVFAIESVVLYMLLSRNPDHLSLISKLLALSALLFFSGMALYSPDNNYRLIWFLPLVIFSFIFINGIFGTLVFVLTLIVLVNLHQSYPAYLSIDAFASLVICLFAVALLAYHFSQQIHAYEEAILSQNQELQKLVNHDHMTGVLNRQGLLEGAAQYFNLANRHYINGLSLVVFDIDHFKAINDTHGHLIGDKSIKQIAELVKTNLRKSDLFARMGGDEFVLLLPETGKLQTAKLLEKIKLEMVEHPLIVGSEAIPIQFSAGVSQLTADTKNFKELFKKADMALYEAKENGRNQVVFAED
ncbi:MAG: GGDEF domain-containing protein [Hydrogenovibrio sp.]|nr:GGDEF domain-containing protein [Hydrogenovibrio sp.]